MTRTQDFSHSAFTTASLSTVASTVADSDHWARWARPYLAQSRCEKWGTDQAYGKGSIRRVGLAPVWIRELVTDWDPARHQTYTMLSPYLFDRYRGMIQFTEAVADGGTRIAWSVDFEPRWSATGKVLQIGMSSVIKRLLGRLVAECDRAEKGEKWTVHR
jgi:hypothetical protein